MPKKCKNEERRQIERWLAYFEAIHRALLAELKAYDKQRRTVVVEVK